VTGGFIDRFDGRDLERRKRGNGLEIGIGVVGQDSAA